MERHLRLVPPLVEGVLPLKQEALPAVTLVPVRARALAQQLALVHQLALDLEEELLRGLEEGLELPQALSQELVLAKVEAQQLGLVLAQVATLARILAQE
jgi:hypothetical protein